jgi:hypothetical protein
MAIFEFSTCCYQRFFGTKRKGTNSTVCKNVGQILILKTARGFFEKNQNGGDIADGVTYVILRFPSNLRLFLIDFSKLPHFGMLYH